MLFRNYLKVVILGQTIDITRGPILVFPIVDSIGKNPCP